MPHDTKKNENFFLLSSKVFCFHGQITPDVFSLTRGHTNAASWMCSVQTDRNLSLQDTLIFGCHSPLPAQRQQQHQKKPFCSFSIWGGMFAKGLILASWFVPAVPRIPRGSHSQAFPTLGLLSPPQAVFCWHGVEPANPATPMFLRLFQCSACSPIRSAFAAFRKESKKFLPKYSNLGD